jgi:RimJ/RimL family protein N-acetyltransferase
MALREILLDVDPRNEPAVRAYQRVGFEAEGITTMRLRRSRWLRVEQGRRSLYTGPPESPGPPS